MPKDYFNIKWNGGRNEIKETTKELKEIRKSIDKLTNAILMAQTNKQHEKIIYHDSSGHFDGKLWNTTTSGSIEQREVSKSD